MKSNKQLKVALEILIILIIIMVSCLGIYINKNGVMTNLLKDYTFSRALSGERQIVLTPVESDEIIVETEESINDLVVSQADLQKSVEIFEKRMLNFGITDYTISSDIETGNIIVHVAESDMLDEMISSVFMPGEFLLQDSETSETLLDNSYINNSQVGYYTNNSGTAIYITIEFNKEGTEKLKEISSNYIATEDEEGNQTSKNVTLKIDGEEITTTYFGEPIENGVLQLSIGQATTDAAALETYMKNASMTALILSSGLVPVEYEMSQNEYIYSGLVKNSFTLIEKIGIAVMTLLVIYLIIVYRDRGIIASIIFLGYVSLLLLILRLTNSVISIESICAIVLGTVFYYFFMIKVLKALKNYRQKDSTPKAEMNKEIKTALFALVPALIISVVFTFIANVAVSSFGITLFWSILIFIVYTFVVTKILLLNFEYIFEE